jgi:high-affinity Fe2+/Pb2+ permease
MVLSGRAERGDTLPSMRRRLWSVAVAGLALGNVAMVGGTAVGGNIGPAAAGYGLIIVVAALYLVAGWAIRERAWRHLSRPSLQRPVAQHLAGRRIF